MSEIKVLSSTAMKTSMDVLMPQFEKASGHKVTFSYGPSTRITEQVADGETNDVAIVTDHGIDALTIGPADLAQDMGVFGTPDQARVMDKMRDRVLAAAKKHGKTCAMLCATPAQVKQWKEAGALLLAYASEVEVLHTAFSKAMAELKA